MDINEKYEKIRPLIKDGDFILFSGTGIVASIIREADDSKISHIGRVVELKGRFLIIDSNADGNHPEWLSTRIERYRDDSDFMIIRSTKSQEEIYKNVKDFIWRSDDERTMYDFKNGIKELINRKFGFKFKIKLDVKHNICSQSVRKDYEALEMGTTQFIELPIAFPEDYLRYRNRATTEVIC